MSRTYSHRPAPPEKSACAKPGAAASSSFRQLVAKLFVLGFVVLSGEWLLHQTTYLLEYGSRFDAVMASTPHRYYMGSLGISFAVAALALLAVLACSLRLLSRHRLALERQLPRRISRRLPVLTHATPPSVLRRTAVIIAAAQLAIFTVQENLESAAVGAPLPGLTAVFSTQHPYVILLDVLIAACLAVLFSAFVRRFDSAKHALRIAAAICRLIGRDRLVPENTEPIEERVPNLRLAPGTLGLRSPPLHA